jgi:hypothetical protein
VFSTPEPTPLDGIRRSPMVRWIRAPFIVSALLLASLSVAACAGSDDSDDESASGEGGCGVGRPEGAYRCSGNTSIEQCRDGLWTYATSCSCLSDGYAATCKPTGATSVHCAYGTGPYCRHCTYQQGCS